MSNKKKGFDLSEYKKSIQVADTPLKMDLYVKVNEALQAVIGLPGFPLGHITQIYGLSDSGKTSLMFHAGAQAQKQGIFPVFIITEGKISFDRMQKMGVQDNYILEQVDYLEDVFKKIDRITSDVVMGKLPFNTMIFVDSLGNTLSRESVEEHEDGTTEIGGAMMKAAKVIREHMRVFSHKINNTRKISSPFSVGLTILNHGRLEYSKMPGIPPKLVPYGGEGVWLAASLVLRTKRIKTLWATVNKEDKGFGIISRISVDKNHINGISNEGDFVIVPDQIIPNIKAAIDEYKEANRTDWTAIKIED